MSGRATYRMTRFLSLKENGICLILRWWGHWSMRNFHRAHEYADKYTFELPKKKRTGIGYFVWHGGGQCRVKGSCNRTNVSLKLLASDPEERISTISNYSESILRRPMKKARSNESNENHSRWV